MSNNLKFFSLMRTLNPAELLGFQKFLKKYHHGEIVVLKVFSYCKRFHDPNTDFEKIDLASVYRQVFEAEMGEHQSDRKKILNPLSDLHLSLKEFLLAEKMRAESWVSKMVWLGILQERGLHRDFSKLATDLYQQQDEKLLPDDAACLRQIATGLCYKRHLVQHQATPDFQALIECAASIKQGADILSMKAACEILNDQKVRPTEPSMVNDPPLQPLMINYQMMFSLLSSGKEEDYHHVVSYLHDHLGILGETEVQTIIRMLHNFAAPKVRGTKNIEWAKQVHALNIILLKKGLYTQKGVMSSISFCNIVNAACLAQELGWARSFMSENADALPENARSESIDLSNAIIAFEEKKFAEVLELVDKPELKYFHHMVRSKALKLRTLYELDPEDDAIEFLYTSFEQYLKRNRKEQPELADATLAFVILFKELHLEKLSKQALLKRIEAAPYLYFRQWLLDKLENYKG